MFKVYSVLPDGNCLFSSLERILKSCNDSHYTAKNFRHLVAYSVLDKKDSTANQVLKQWFDIAGGSELDREIKTDFRHIVALQDKTWPPNEITRRWLYHYMRDNNMYWGEEYALCVLEKALQIQIIIINENGDLRDNRSNHWNEDFKKNYRPTRFCLVRLKCRHYEPLSYNGIFLFSPRDLQIFPSSFSNKLKKFIFH